MYWQLNLPNLTETLVTRACCAGSISILYYGKVNPIQNSIEVLCARTMQRKWATFISAL